MAAVNAGLPREGAGEGQEPLALAMQLMAQALAQMQTAVRQQEQRRQEDQAAISALTARMRQQEQRRQEDQAAIRALTARVHQQDERREEDLAAIRALTARVRQLEERGGAATEQQPLEALERRMGSLEASVQRALKSVFPRVEALVAQLETSSPPGAPSSSISSSSPTPSTRYNVSPSKVSLPAAAVTSACAPSISRPSEVARPMPTAAWTSTSTPEPRSLHASTSVGADPLVKPEEAREDSVRDLISAVEEGRVEDVGSLLDRGVDVNCRDWGGWTPLMNAAWFVQESVLQVLLDRGADPDLSGPDGSTVLHIASVRDRTARCVEMLICAGADTDCTNEHGNTPMNEAIKCGNKRAVEALQKCGASSWYLVRRGRGHRGVVIGCRLDLGGPDSRALSDH